MILWCDGAHDPAENMRRDRALLDAAEAGAPPVLRLFRFVPHGITLGIHQRPERTLDLDRCRADGIPWAERPTGGRAIFHAEEWTYALATPIDDPEWGGNLREAYARASRLVLASLVRLGVPAEFASSSPAPDATGAGRDACFASAAAHELLLEGRKVAGSAQRRGTRALLQQGSILLGEGHLRLADYLALGEAGRDRAREALRRATAPAAKHLGVDAPLERWADALGAELGAAVSRFDGEAGAFLLLPPTTRSYTASPV
jgi:lipoate-protein ligase A